MQLGSSLLSVRLVRRVEPRINKAAACLGDKLTELMTAAEPGNPFDDFQLLGPEKVYLGKYITTRRREELVMPIVAFALAGEEGITDTALIDRRLLMLAAFAAEQATAADPYIVSV